MILSRRPGSIEITVHDDGRGFSPDVPGDGRQAMHGAGLAGIRERTRILGGRVDIQSSARTGTTLTVTIPLEEGAHA